MKNYSRSVMSRYAAQINTINLWAMALVISLGLSFGAPVQAYAASKAPSEIHKIAFDSAANDRSLTLDWRRAEADLSFQIPDNDWVDRLELLITMRPDGPVRSDVPITVQFNDGLPVPITSDGHGFDARLDLDPARLKGQRNRIRVRYPTPAGESCLGPGHGSWEIDVQSSYVVVKSRAKSRGLGFHDVKTALTLPATAPKSVVILAKGPQALQYEVLAAQGLARNMDGLPNFKTVRGGADLEIVAATRSNLAPWVKDQSILKGRGALVAIAKSGTMQIVLTGDTDAQVLSAVKAFAAFTLPSSRAHEFTPDRYGRLDILQSKASHIHGRTLLSALGGASFSHDWAPAAQHIRFNVANPAASSGTLTLSAKTGPFVAPNSVLAVSLNGKALGSLPLPKRSNRIKIDIPRGMLQGRDNHLVLSPDLRTSETEPTCAGTRMGSGFVLDPKSSLTIAADSASNDVNLSRFAASGAPFSTDYGRGATVVIDAKSGSEKNAVLKVMAKLGQASGQAWSEANFVSGADGISAISGHVLFIGSQNVLDLAQLSGAPKGLKVAIGGTHYQEPVPTRSAVYANGAMNVLSARQVIQGGVAALYRDPMQAERVVGVITQTHGQSFARAAENLTHNDHWNQLQGSVSRWNEVQVMMAQTAFVSPHADTSTGFEMPDFAANISMPDMGAWGSALSGHWQSLSKTVGGWTQTAKALFQKKSPEKRDALAPLNARPSQASPLASIPVPSLKRPSRISTPVAQSETVRMPATLRPISAPPKTAENRLAPVNAAISSSYAAASRWAAQTVEHAGLGQNRGGETLGVNLLVMALIAIGLLIALVFISPHASGRAAKRQPYR